MLRRSSSTLLLAAAVLGVIGCKPRQAPNALPNPRLREPNVAVSRETDRRLLYAQIVEDDHPDIFDESGIIEGVAYKYMLRSLVGVTHDALRKNTNDQITFERLMTYPGLYRGHVHTLNRGVCLEIGRAEAPPEYGLPAGYTILPAVFVDSARDVYALRILCPPNSKLYERLQKGIEDDALPVLRVSGYFMKLYARATSDPREPPWRRPLLICPELELSQAVEPRKVADEMAEAKMDRLLPSKRIEAVGAEERLVLEARRGPGGKPVFSLGGADLRGDFKAIVAEAVAALRKRLPKDQADDPAAVILQTMDAPDGALDQAAEALRAAGVERLAVKREDTRE